MIVLSELKFWENKKTMEQRTCVIKNSLRLENLQVIIGILFIFIRVAKAGCYKLLEGRFHFRDPHKRLFYDNSCYIYLF